MDLFARRRELLKMGGGLLPLEVTLVDDSFVRFSDGDVRFLADFFYTSTLFVRAGQQVVFSGYAGGSTAAIYAGTQKPYTPLVKGTGSTAYRTYTWTADADTYVGFSAKRGATPPVATIDGVNVTFNGY